MRLVDYVVVLVLIAAGVVISVGLSRPVATSLPPATRSELSALADRQQESEASTAVRLADLEARVAALEGAPIREGAPAPEAWSPADVAALRAGLEMVKVAERRDREAQQLRNVVAHIVPDAEPAVRERVVTLLQQTIEQARAEPERAGALRADLLTKLGETFPVDIAGRLAGLVPGGEPSEDSR